MNHFPPPLFHDSRSLRYAHLLVILGAFGLAALLITGCPAGRNGQEIVVTVNDEGGGEARSPKSPTDRLTLARTEGEVVWYTSISDKEASSYAARFQAKYPGVKVRVVREGTFDLVARLEREIGSGQPSADVLHVLDPAIFAALRQKGELLAYDAPAASAVAPEYRDASYWTAARLVTVGLAYDSRRLSAAQAPKRWSDLLQPRWKGKLGLKDAQTAGSAYAQYYALRERYGVSFWEQMAAQKPKVFKTEEDLLDALLAGEIQVAAGVMGHKLLEYTRKGQKSLVTIWPTDGVPMVVGPVAILSRATHPNAARLFVDYTLSTDGQKAFRDLLGAYAPRSDVAAPPGWPPLASLKLLRPNAGWREYLEKQGALRAEYSRLFHAESE